MLGARYDTGQALNQAVVALAHITPNPACRIAVDSVILMGAQLSTVAPTATVPIDAYVSELGDITYSSDLGRARFLKTVKAIHRDGVVAVKVFIKPATTQIDIGPIKAQVQRISENLRHDLGPLNEFPNTLGYSRIVETERAAYLVRQYIKHSLYDRISTRPFLEPIEKNWITYQLIRALKSCHASNIFHGDIKSENVLVGSWKWVFLVDFASFKPVRLPETDSAQFLFYFDVSQRRACYVAPERFADEGPETLNAQMDVYSAGCVIAELFLDGQPLFSLADLFRYKKGEYMPDLSSIDPKVQELISSMVSVDPSVRLSAAEYLEKYRSTLFPDYFETFWNLLVPFSGSAGETCSDRMVKHLWDHFEGDILDRSLKLGTIESTQSEKITSSSLPVVVALPNLWHEPKARQLDGYLEDHGSLIILSYVCSALKSTSSVDWRLRAAELVLLLAEFVPDDAKLDRCLPYLVFLLRDSQPIIKARALVYITHLMSMVRTYSSLNEKVYTAYLFPRITQCLNSSSPAMMRAEYAECLPTLAEKAVECEGYQSVLQIIEDAARFLLVDKESMVRRTFLIHADGLCNILQKQGTNDIILSHAITYLNDKDSSVRMDLFRFIAKIAPLVGPVGIEQYIVPLLIQSLCESREDMVALVIQSLASIVEVGLVRLKTLLAEVVPSAVKFLIHPNVYCRTQALLLIVAAAKQLSRAQNYCMLRPLLSPFFHNDIGDYGDLNSLIEALKPHMYLSVYMLALQWASKAEKSAFWQATANPASATVSFSQEDRRWLSRLREVGFNNEDLWQLLVFKDYLWQLSLMPDNAHAASQGLDNESQRKAQETEVIYDKLNSRFSSRKGLASWKSGPAPRGLEEYIRSQGHGVHDSLEKHVIRIQNKRVDEKTASLDNSSSWVEARNCSARTLDMDFVGTETDHDIQGAREKSRPPSVLVTSIKAHRGAIQVLAQHSNSRLFATGADDGNVKIWDVRLLLKGSSRSVAVWSTDSPIKASAFLPGTSILATGTLKGTIYFLKCKSKSGDSSILNFDTPKVIAEFNLEEGYPVVIHPSKTDIWILVSTGLLIRYELASLKMKDTLKCSQEFGSPSCWAWSPREDWVIVGTLHGMLELFDIRFGLRVNSWGIGELQPITALDNHPLKEHCVCVTGGFQRNLISVWDVQKLELCELLIPVSDLDKDDDALPSLVAIPSTLHSLPERFAEWSLDDTFNRPKLSVTSLASSKLGGSRLLSGGGDKILRCWNLQTPHESSVICGTSYNRPKFHYMGKAGFSTKYTYELTYNSKGTAKLSRGTSIGLEEHDIGRNHRGTILGVALVELPNGRDLAISVDEVGVVKVFC